LKIEDLNVSIEDTIFKIKDVHMQRYIDEVISIKYMPLRHNNNRQEDYYISPLHERTGMLYGNILYIEYIGEIMQEKFGHNYRSKSVYTTFFGDKQYGDSLYIVLPFGGNYDMCYSPDIHDMYHEVPTIKNEAFEKVYTYIKSEIKDKNVLSVWNDIEYDLVHEMKKSLQDYTQYLNAKIPEEQTKEILDVFSKHVLDGYNKRIESYKVTNSLIETYNDIGRMYNPIIEVMVRSPKFLMISYNYIMKKYRDVDYFFDAIK